MKPVNLCQNLRLSKRRSLCENIRNNWIVLGTRVNRNKHTRTFSEPRRHWWRNCSFTEAGLKISELHECSVWATFCLLSGIYRGLWKKWYYR